MRKKLTNRRSVMKILLVFLITLTHLLVGCAGGQAYLNHDNSEKYEKPPNYYKMNTHSPTYIKECRNMGKDYWK